MITLQRGDLFIQWLISDTEGTGKIPQFVTHHMGPCYAGDKLILGETYEIEFKYTVHWDIGTKVFRTKCNRWAYATTIRSV